MRIINCGGYGNTGCTAQTDFLSDHEGVAGGLRPFHELGFLKCYYSFGGVFLAIQDKWKHVPTKAEVRNSLQGKDPNGPVELNEGSKMHLELRRLLARQHGEEALEKIVDNALAELPDTFDHLTTVEIIPLLRHAVSTFVEGLIANSGPAHFHPGEYDPETSVIGFKNDPPGAYPIFASFLAGGLSSAILRDPRDTTYDFNRHYGLGHSMQTVVNHCRHYNAQLNSARSQIQRYEDQVRDVYKVIDFENLVSSEAIRDAYRDHMVGPRKRVRHSFDAEKSGKNVLMWKQLPKEFIDHVEENCLQNYTEFRSFLTERGMLLE